MNTFAKSLLSILVVEDHPFSREAFVSMLKRTGFENVKSAEDGESAVTILNTDPIDLVITDINMPNQNGIELIKKIRTSQTKSSQYTSIIAVTTLSDAATTSACMTLEVDAFLVKPISVKEAQQKILLAISEPKELYQQHLYADISTEISLSPKNLQPETKQPRIKEVSCHFFIPATLSELKSEMTILDDIELSNGSCLLKAGTLINQKLLRRLYELSEVVQFGHIRVRVDQKDTVT
ncbi:response regulator [Vibrio gallaecicus]|uniref:response regulator n=1 Tax=Vibrio gallaecicus TaxID=552386 RepID=UPI0010C93E30|nr:response regulator [Vibrio gallaecicus]MDN3613391.1 response regulator [Vibrio gallaecicus]